MTCTFPSFHAFYVGPDGAIKEPISADVRSKFLGKPLSEVIGKEAAEKLLSTKVGESQTLKEEGLAFGGQGMKGFYDNILPKTANKLLEKLGSKIEPVVMEGQVPSRLRDDYASFMDWMAVNHPKVNAGDAASSWIWRMGDDRHFLVQEYYEATKPIEQLGFKITPEMIELVKTKGLPQFAKGGEISTKDFIQANA
jgi:hypothetical protein